MFSKILNTFSTKFITAIINFFIAVIISQYLGATGKGEQGIIITTITLILIFSNLIGGPSIVYLVPRHPLQRIVIPAYAWSLLTSIIFFFIMNLVYIVKPEYILHVVILTTINSFASINNSVLIGKEKIKTNNYINLLQTIVIIGSLLFFFNIQNKIEIYSYIKALYFGFGINFILGFIFIIPFFKKQINPTGKFNEALQGLLKFGFWNQLGTIAQMLSFRISYYFIEYFNGTKDVGIYSNGISIIESVWLVTTSITLVQYSRIVNSENNEYSQKLTIRLTRISLLSIFFILIPLVLLPSSFYTFIFGHEFGDINKVIWTLAPGVLIFNIVNITGHYFSGTGKYHINALAMGVGFAATLIFGLILIPLYGIIGAGITASISYIVTAIVISIIFSKEAKCRIIDLMPKPGDIKNYYNEFILLFQKK
ncbi:MAG TPA: oligosaccharide flippase family protein [Bacteroidales bacterium]|nr:oligosaccharide flippase family protein [Bacteroidales bacterium]HPS17851.1 oligosaccharide flippase family protein [Bacteroidales bacterium]